MFESSHSLWFFFYLHTYFNIFITDIHLQQKSNGNNKTLIPNNNKNKLQTGYKQHTQSEVHNTNV